MAAGRHLVHRHLQRCPFCYPCFTSRFLATTVAAPPIWPPLPPVAFLTPPGSQHTTSDKQRIWDCDTAMPEDERLYSIRSLIFDYVKSPSLRHVREPHFVAKLAKDILRTVDRGTGPWQKWDAVREAMLTSAATTWIPVEDLRDYFNTLTGPKLTTTDVAQRLRQRLRAIQEDGFGLFPKDALKEGCLALYQRERDAGTEMAAIIGAVQEYAEQEEERVRSEREQSWKQTREAEREALRQRLISGVDCKWTSLTKSEELFCRMNGRLYRVKQGQDKRWSLYRVASLDDANGALLGQYSGRGEANKVVAKIAYEAEPRW